MKVYLIRHGETEWNCTYKMQGAADNPLNANGLRQAMAVSLYCKEIPFDHAYSSPLIRAMETCRIMIRDRECPMEVLDCITEMDYGAYEGSDIRRVMTDESEPMHDFLCRPERFTPPEGAESLDHVVQRGQKFVKEWLIPNEDKYQHLLVATHGAFMRGMLEYVESADRTAFWSSQFENCSMTVLDCTGGKITVEKVGEDLLSKVPLLENNIYL